MKTAALFLAVTLALPAHGMTQDELLQANLLPGWRMDSGHHMAGLSLALAPGWKTYWRSPGEAGIPPEFDWSGSQNVKAVYVHWPSPVVFHTNGMQTVGYDGGVILPLEVVPEVPGQPVVLQTPNYRPIRLAPGHWNLPKIEVPFELKNGEYLTPLPALRDALAGAGALLLSNPHNPMGKVFPREELLAVANACLEQGALIISDEIHAELCFDGRRHIPTASLSAQIADRTITLMSASKAYNVAGLKTCFAVIQNAEIRERFNNARCGMVDSVSPLGLEATRAAYSQCGAWLDALKQYLQANRDYLLDAVKTRLPGVVMHAPQGTFLAWLDCSALGLDDPQLFFLEQAKVGLSAGIEFGDDSQQFVRLNFGCPRALLEEGVQRMERSLQNR